MLVAQGKLGLQGDGRCETVRSSRVLLHAQVAVPQAKPQRVVARRRHPKFFQGLRRRFIPVLLGILERQRAQIGLGGRCCLGEL